MSKKVYRALVLILLSLLCFAIFSGAGNHRAMYPGESLYAVHSKAIFYVRALDGAGNLKSAGSGFLIREDGLALTAAHVVSSASQVHVVLESGEELPIEVLHIDDFTDIALLKLPESAQPYPALTVAEHLPSTGETMYAIGYPLKTTKIMSDGIVANSETYINGVARTLVTADFASGMSGGPILNRCGEVIGICSATLRTMNGVSSTPTVAQLLCEIESER